jgi:hypothetical protein
MNNDEILLDAVYTKLKIGEPLSIQDLDRWINFLGAAPIGAVSKPGDQDIAAIQSKLINMLQQKFMQPQKQ